MEKRSQNKAIRTEKIYEAAMKLFGEKGFLQTTLQDVAEAAEISTRTLYLYFPTKESILHMASKRSIDETEEFARLLPIGMSAKRKILLTIMKNLELVYDPGFFLNVHSTNKESSVLARQMEMENMRRYEDVFASILKQEQRNRGIENGADCRMAAEMVVAMHRYFTKKIYCEDEKFDYQKIEKVFEQALEFGWPSIEKNLLSKA